MAIEVVLLGTGNPLPDRDRAGAATLVRAGGRTLLVRRGTGCVHATRGRGRAADHARRGVPHASAQRPHLRPQRRRHHPVGDEPGSEAVADLRSAAAPTRSSTGCARCSRPDVEYRLAHHPDLTWEPQIEVAELSPGVVLDEDGLRIVAAATDHRPVEPTLGYRVEFDGQVGRARGRHRAVRRARRALPRAPTCTCRPCCATTSCAWSRCNGSSTRSTTTRRSSRRRRPRRAAACGTLVLTHQIPTPAPDAADEWIAIAREHFAGEIVFGEDLTSVTVP